MSGVVSRLVNRPSLLNMLGRLGVRAPLWRMYCRLFGPEGGIIHLDLDGRHARFYVHSAWIAEDLKTFGRGERALVSRLVSTLKTGDVVYDVGANMGLHSVFFGQAVGPAGQIIAFEPEPHYCERLRSNVSLNGLSNVRIFPLALGEHSYASELLPAVRGLASPRLAELSEAQTRARAGQEVRVIEGDRLVETEKLPVPRLVKIDVEGHEYAVLRGLRGTLANPGCEVVCCEVHPKLLPKGVNPEKIVSLVRSCEFTRVEILPRPPEMHVIGFKGGGMEGAA
ncbi:MAG: hypothetical protein DMG21_07505 [Acidobacteria bacterium]|nr:MAG: hypothetical protein DMG21_07505 [Acidobacteriota bacterium]